MGDDDDTLQKIRHRWAATNLVLTWQQIPKARRERVVAELEEDARALADTEPQIAADLTAALDVLDSEDNAPLLELLKQAQADIHVLLAKLGVKRS